MTFMHLPIYFTKSAIIYLLVFNFYIFSLQLKKKDVLQILKDELLTSVQPLNELADRTVFKDDVENVKNSLTSL